ncbi:MAG: FkbM family methyltransferase [Bacteroidetes bacterium]|nr:FkbM family methyltransferase [Bacteroidota bacterium]
MSILQKILSVKARIAAICNISKKIRYYCKIGADSYSDSEINFLKCLVAYNNCGGYCIPISSLHGPTAKKIIPIMQLDVEGYENQVFFGALETIQHCRPVLILEDNANIIDISWFSENILSRGRVISSNLHNNTILEFT